MRRAGESTGLRRPNLAGGTLVATTWNGGVAGPTAGLKNNERKEGLKLRCFDKWERGGQRLVSFSLHPWNDALVSMWRGGESSGFELDDGEAEADDGESAMKSTGDFICWRLGGLEVPNTTRFECVRESGEGRRR